MSLVPSPCSIEVAIVRLYMEGHHNLARRLEIQRRLIRKEK